MSNTNSFNYRNLRLAIIITLVVAVVVLYLSYSIGKDELFLLLNGDLGAVGDFFFNYFTHAGDGLLWIVWLVAILKTKRKHLLPLLIGTFALSTIFTQVGKLVIYPDELRPSEALKQVTLGVTDQEDLKSVNGVPVKSIQDLFDQISPLKAGDSVHVAYELNGKQDTIHIQLKKQLQFHFVKGVDVHSYSSFPSGHTATAFCFAFLIALLVRSAGLSLMCVVAALTVGYTRIYLGQHYPLDVAAGMIVASISIVLAVLIQKWFDKRRLKKVHAST